MFEKLGNAIKSGIDKIAGAVFVDKRTIDAALKDIQRAIANYTYAKHTSDAHEKQSLELLADQYVAKALKYMEANIDDFPTFEATEQYVSTRTTIKNYENLEENTSFVFGG